MGTDMPENRENGENAENGTTSCQWLWILMATTTVLALCRCGVAEGEGAQWNGKIDESNGQWSSYRWRWGVSAGPRRYLRPISYIYTNKTDNRNRRAHNKRAPIASCWRTGKSIEHQPRERAKPTSNFAYVIISQKHIHTRARSNTCWQDKSWQNAIGQTRTRSECQCRPRPFRIYTKRRNRIVWIPFFFAVCKNKTPFACVDCSMDLSESGESC